MKHTVKRVWCLLLSLCLICAVIPAGIAVRATQTEAEYHHADDLSEGVENIVKRARQMLQVQWTPQKDIVGWGDVVYKAGQTYTGLPYGRPTDGDYVPWEISLTAFVDAVNDPDSRMYTAWSTNQGRAPYYSLDCSAFVSWAWDLEGRQYTYSLPDYATKISDTSYEKMEVGDCLNRTGWHVVLVTDIVYDASGRIVAVEISESDGDAPDGLCRSVWFGRDHSLSMSDFQETYLDDGYVLYRSKTRDSVTYSHSCAFELVQLEAQNPTCTADGTSACWTCAECGRFYADADAAAEITAADITVKAAGHRFGSYVSDGNATRRDDGTETAVCENCGAADTRIEEGSRKGYGFLLPLAAAMIAVLAALGLVLKRRQMRRRRRRRRRPREMVRS